MINGLDLFSGIGGISYALGEWVRPLAYCEAERYCQGVLLSKMRSGELSRAPIWDDVRTLGQALLPKIDIIYGGFPCQDISTAGAGAGLEGSRSGLFFEIIRLTRELRPKFIFLENVPAITVRGLDRILLEFTSIGYDCRWTIVSAAEMGAPHLRERWFLLAHSVSERLRESEQQQGRNFEAESWNNGTKESLANSDSVWKSPGSKRGDITGNRAFDRSETMADAKSIGSVKGRLPGRSQAKHSLSVVTGEYFRRDYWAAEPDVGRVAHGIPARVDRLRGLGNAVVPLQAREAFERLAGLK